MKLSILFVICLIGLPVFSQSPDYSDLVMLYADGSYEKLIGKAEKYTTKDDTKKDPNPYIFMAKGYYKISVSGEAGEDFKNAFKDALGAFGKARKYDTDGEATAKHADFINEFTLSAAERIINDVGAEDFKKAYSWNVKYNKVAKDLGGTLFMEGACKYRNADKSGANNSWKEAEVAMENVSSLEDWWEADKKLLRVGLIETARVYIDSRQVEKARTLLDKYKPLFTGNNDFEADYQEIMN
ncbi:MAG: hypothetical protein KJ941_07295 [Bacteroidetes bacterium]|nr:hypothetical protein [Bacteroidota bacterium]